MARLTQAVRCVRRPNRTAKRVFTAQAIGKLVCRYLAQRPEQINIEGRNVDFANVGLQGRLRDAIGDCLVLCPDQAEENAEEQAEAQVNEAVQSSLIGTLEQNKTAIGIGLAVLVSLAFVPRLISILPAGLLALMPFAARTVGPKISAAIIQLRKQEAANDAVIRVVRQLKKAA